MAHLMPTLLATQSTPIDLKNLFALAAEIKAGLVHKRFDKLCYYDGTEVPKDTNGCYESIASQKPNWSVTSEDQSTASTKIVYKRPYFLNELGIRSRFLSPELKALRSPAHIYNYGLETDGATTGFYYYTILKPYYTQCVK